MNNNSDSYDIGEMLNEYVAGTPDKEVRIINAAINAFSEKGFANTKTREIAQRAGIAEGTIFRYFPTKNAILERMVPLLIRVMQPRLEKPLQTIIAENYDAPTRTIFKAILLDRLRVIRENGPFIKSVLPELVHRAPLLNQLKDSLIPVIDSYVCRVIEHGKERGEIRADVDPHILVYQLMGFVLSYSMFSSPHGEDETKKDVEAFLKYATEGWCVS